MSIGKTVVAVVLALWMLSTSTIVSAAPDAGAPATGGGLGAATADEAFVIAAFNDFLDRDPTEAELTEHTAEPLDTRAARTELLAELTTSNDWITTTVDRFYSDTLGRPGDTGGTAFWVDQLQSGKRSVARVAAWFYSSGEYFNGYGQSDVRAWVTDLYEKILLRDPANDQSGVDYWVDRTEARGRVDVAHRFYQSDESRRTRVTLLYAHLLDRSPDPDGHRHWADEILTEGDLALAASLARSQEYYDRASNRYGIDTPDAPTDVVAVHGNAEATVTWTVPTDDGGSPITGYVITPYTGTAALTPTEVDADTTTVTITGLTNGTEHTFTVAATNAAGTGTESSPSNAVTPIGPVATAVGVAHSCAAMDDGRVRCWGDNAYGQLGDGTTNTTSTPVPVSGIDNATQITGGRFHSCARLDSGRIECWGHNGYGQLGDDTTTGSSTPVPVSGIDNATQVVAGPYHTCAALDTGQVRCWGTNADGQLGDGTTNTTSAPVEVVGVDNATQVAAGDHHTCARLDTGRITCWGRNSSGQLGNGTTTGSPTPVVVSDIDNATQAATAGLQSCARLDTGQIRCWGNNTYGQLGNGTSTGSSTPVTVSDIDDATQIATGGYQHFCALFGTGQVACWGNNTAGQLGNGEPTSSKTPAVVSGIDDATQIATGPGHTCATVDTGQVRCWGDNRFGQLGDGTTDDSWTPVVVVGL